MPVRVTRHFHLCVPSFLLTIPLKKGTTDAVVEGRQPMAVQAPYPAFAFPPDFAIRASSSLDELYAMQDPRNFQQLQSSNLGTGGAGMMQQQQQQQQQQLQQQILNYAEGFGERHGEFTANQYVAQACQINPAISLLFANPSAMPAPANLAGGSDFSQTRLPQSVGASTSGRCVSEAHREIVSLIYRQNLELDNLIRAQTEGLRAELEEARRRHCRALLSELEQRVAARLNEKQAELESASQRNAELAEQVQRMAEESQMWFTTARENEAMVSNLRSALEETLLRCPNNAGFGEGDASYPADDAESTCFDAEGRTAAPDSYRNIACKACGQSDAGVLLLPCRHLSLCRECDATVDTCPVCGHHKNASFRVFLC